jgi:simple sugar transport system permease protein
VNSDPAVVTILTVGIALAVPILWAALGELVNELAGVINIGVEGVMLFAALVTAIAMHATDSFLLSALAGLGTGAVCGLVLAWWYVVRGMNQIVTGIVFNILALGLTTSIYSSTEYLSADLGRTLPDVAIPLLSEIPWVGTVLFDQDALVYAAVVAAVVLAYLLRGTWFGLYVRAAGERPSAVETTGRHVFAVRIAALTIGSALAGVGGATLILSTSGGFNINITSGIGYIALAVVVLARWNPLATVGACAIFGVAQAMQFQVDEIDALASVPVEVWMALPYLVTLLALVFARGTNYPPACGVAFRRPGRSWASLLRERLRSRRPVVATTEEATS